MVNFLQPFGNTELTYPFQLGSAPPEAPTVNVAFVVDASSSMYINNGVSLPVDFEDFPLVALPDLDGNGVPSTLADLAYYAIEQFIPQIVTAAGPLTYRIQLIAFNTGLSPFTTSRTYTGPSDLALWADDIFTAGTQGASTPALGIDAALAWFASISADTADTNRIIVLTDGLVTMTGVASSKATFNSTLAGTMHARMVTTAGALSDPLSTSIGADAVAEMNDDTVTADDEDFGFFAVDQPTAENALRSAEIFPPHAWDDAALWDDTANWTE